MVTSDVSFLAAVTNCHGLGGLKQQEIILQYLIAKVQNQLYQFQIKMTTGPQFLLRPSGRSWLVLLSGGYTGHGFLHGPSLFCVPV